MGYFSSCCIEWLVAALSQEDFQVPVEVESLEPISEPFERVPAAGKPGAIKGFWDVH